jgi:hypothetical protein
MTSSKAMIKAFIEGTDADTTDASPGPRRPHGIIRAREDQVYYVTGLASSALYEADHLVKMIQNTASALRITYDGTEATGPLDMTYVLSVLGEALDCIDLASEALSALSNEIRCRQEDEEP